MGFIIKHRIWVGEGLAPPAAAEPAVAICDGRQVPADSLRCDVNAITPNTAKIIEGYPIIFSHALRKTRIIKNAPQN